MTWNPTRDPVPMTLRAPVTPGSLIPREIAWTMRKSPRDEMTTGEAEAYRRGYARGWAEAMAEIEELRNERDRWRSSAQERLRRWHETTLEFRAFVQHGKAQEDRLRAAEAALAWQPIETAPKDGTWVHAMVDGERRIVAWGKTSHLPWVGFCLADQGPEDFDLCKPTLWHPFPAPPETASAGAAEAGDGAGGGGGSADAAGGVQAREIGVSGGGP